MFVYICMVMLSTLPFLFPFFLFFFCVHVLLWRHFIYYFIIIIIFSVIFICFARHVPSLYGLREYINLNLLIWICFSPAAVARNIFIVIRWTIWISLWSIYSCLSQYDIHKYNDLGYIYNVNLSRIFQNRKVLTGLYYDYEVFIRGELTYHCVLD